MDGHCAIFLYNPAFFECQSIEQIIQRGLAHIRNWNETATIELRITEMLAFERPRSFVIALTPLGAFLEEDPLTESDLTVTLSYGTLIRLTDGSYSLLEAYLAHDLEVKGDLELARRLAKRIEESGLLTDQVNVELKALSAPRL